MKLLLDTHVLLWWLSEPERLFPRAHDAIASGENEVFLSAVVVWEIRIKQGLGKLQLPAAFRSVLSDQAFVDLPMTAEHAHAVGQLPAIHRDPFDRMLVAQALCEGLTVVTRDRSIRAYPAPCLTA